MSRRNATIVETERLAALIQRAHVAAYVSLHTDPASRHTDHDAARATLAAVPEVRAGVAEIGERYYAAVARELMRHGVTVGVTIGATVGDQEVAVAVAPNDTVQLATPEMPSGSDEVSVAANQPSATKPEPEPKSDPDIMATKFKATRQQPRKGKAKADATPGGMF